MLGVLQLPPTDDGNHSWEPPGAQHRDIPCFQSAKSKTLPRSVRRCKSRRLQRAVLRDGAGEASTVSRGDTETSSPSGEGTQHGRGREAPLEQFLLSGSRNTTQLSFGGWAVGICFLILSSALWDRRLRSAAQPIFPCVTARLLLSGGSELHRIPLRPFCPAARLPACPTPGAASRARSAPRCALSGAVTPGGAERVQLRSVGAALLPSFLARTPSRVTLCVHAAGGCCGQRCTPDFAGVTWQ